MRPLPDANAYLYIIRAGRIGGDGKDSEDLRKE
jgi:hypothetical protein